MKHSNAETSILMRLPNELLLHLLRRFLDLADVWQLLQVSKSLRWFAMDTIHTRWKIEMTPSSDTTTMKIQCRAALIALQSLSCQLSLQTRAYTSFGYSHLPPPPPTTTSTTAPLYDSQLPWTPTEHPPPRERTPTPTEDSPPLSFDTMANQPLSVYDEEGNEFLLTTIHYDTKLFSDLMQKEERLHQRIIRGISSYKHKYVLIEDIDIRNRIRTAVDVIFHHAVFVAALSRPPVRWACPHAGANHRAMAAMMVRLLTRLDAAFPSYCREITYTLADNIKAFLEYTGYKLLAMTQHHDPTGLSPLVFGSYAAVSPPLLPLPPLPSSSSSSSPPPPLPFPPSSSSLSLPPSSFSSAFSSSSSSSSYALSSFSSHPLHTPRPTHARQPSLLHTLHSISACFDLMGAAFIGKILTESHVECAVQRTCELLSEDHLRSVKRGLLVDLFEGWLTIKRGLLASELCRLVRLEIDKCDRHGYSSRRPLTRHYALVD